MISDAKRDVEKEMTMTLDLLAEASVNEPTVLGKLRASLFLLVFFAASCISNLLVTISAEGGLQVLYLAKAIFTGLGFVVIMKKSFAMNRLYTGIYGATVLLESIPMMFGVIFMMNKDVCGNLVRASASAMKIEGFSAFCRSNQSLIQLAGCAMLCVEMMCDSLAVYAMVQYCSYLKLLKSEHESLRRYTGKERLEIP